MGELVIGRGKNPLSWPDYLFGKLDAGKEHDKTLKILHNVTDNVSFFLNNCNET